MRIMMIMIMTNGLMLKMLMTGTVKFQHMEDSVYNPVSFSSHHTYLGMPQVRQLSTLHCFFYRHLQVLNVKKIEIEVG